MERLLLLGLNHSTAPLIVREKLAFNRAQQRTAIQAFRARFGSAELTLLSTCNRVELYVGREQEAPSIDDLIDFIASFHGIEPAQFTPHLYQRAGREVVHHLFSVASSLDSMVLGETQILGQVRDAYDMARELAAAGPLLHPLFQRAIGVGKQVMSQTSIGEGRLSVASVAVDYARRIFDRFSDKTVLCIGAGKMAQLVLQNFAALAPGRTLICNRDIQKAQTLAHKFGGEAVPFERLAEHLIACDIVVSSTGSQLPVITRNQFEKLLKPRRYRPIFLIDIALPRDIEASVGQIENVYLYNLDDLQQVVSSTQSQRKDALARARDIVAEQVGQFAVWHRSRELGPVIDSLRRKYHQLAQDELARTLNKLTGISDAHKAHLEEFARRLVNKLLHDPVKMLRHSESMHQSTAQYLHAMEKLFSLDTDARQLQEAGSSPATEASPEGDALPEAESLPDAPSDVAQRDGDHREES